MIISFEGLPGCRKTELFNELIKYGINVKKKGDGSLDGNNAKLKSGGSSSSNNSSSSSGSSNGVGSINYLNDEIGRLMKIFKSYKDKGEYYSSTYSLKEVYVNHLYENKFITVDEFEAFNTIYNDLYVKPDYIIYLYGDINDGFVRYSNKKRNKKNFIKTMDDYVKLYRRFEWVFDMNNNKIPIFKVCVDDTIQSILSNVLSILTIINEKIPE